MDRAQPGSGSEVTVADLLGGAWQDRYWLFGILLASLLIGAGVGYWMQPVYRGIAITVPAEPNRGANGIGGILGQLGGVASAVGINLPAGGNHFESLALLESRGFLASFIEKRNLMPELFPERWDAEKKSWRPGRPAPTIDDGAKLFGERVLLVSEDKRTGVITIAVDWTDRYKVAIWANELVSELNTELRRRAAEDAQRTLGYLEKELQSTRSVEIRQALFKLVESQLQAAMLANVQQEYALKVIDQARTPGVDERVRPRRALIFALCIAVAALLGLGLTAARTAARRKPA